MIAADLEHGSFYRCDETFRFAYCFGRELRRRSYLPIMISLCGKDRKSERRLSRCEGGAMTAHDLASGNRDARRFSRNRRLFRKRRTIGSEPIGARLQTAIHRIEARVQSQCGEFTAGKVYTTEIIEFLKIYFRNGKYVFCKIK